MAQRRGNPLGVITSHPFLILALLCGAGAAYLLFGLPDLVPDDIAGMGVIGPVTRALIAYDVVCAVFVASVMIGTGGRSPDSMARWAARQDEGRGIWLFVGVAGAVASGVAIVNEFGAAHALSGPEKNAHIAFVFITIALSWLFIHTIFAAHYAHEYYAPDDESGTREGLKFPGDDAPTFWDFIHFAYVIGVAAQTADIAITCPEVRRVVTWHCVMTFLFNTGVLAITINVAATFLG